MQADVNTMASVGHSPLQGAQVMRPLTLAYIWQQILHSPQLRHEAVLGRSTSLRHGPGKRPQVGAHLGRAFSMKS